MAFDTAGNIVNDAAVSLGLVSFGQAPADPFASSDANIGQLCQLLKEVGRDLVREREWSHLLQTYTFNTVQGTARYPLPLDYSRFINQTAWNRTNRLPVGGPLTPQNYEYLKARLVGVVFNVLFRVIQQQFQAYPDTNTPGDYVIAYEYVSSFWVLPQAVAARNAVGTWAPGAPYNAGDTVTNGGNVYVTVGGGMSGAYGPVGTGSGISDGGINDWTWVSNSGDDAPSASSDIVEFDAQLVVRALKLAFLRAKGFDTTAAQGDYDTTLAKVAADDTPSEVLRLDRPNMGEPLLGERNLPITGFGS